MGNWSARPRVPRTLEDEHPEDFVGERAWWRWMDEDEVREPGAMRCDCGALAVVLSRAGFETWMCCEECAEEVGVFEDRERARRGR